MKHTLFFMGLLFSFTAFSQNYDFGKVSTEELQEKFNPLDSSANAAYLYKYRRTYFQYRKEKGFELLTDIQERIKIYNKEGFEFATIKVNLRKSGNEDEQVGSLKAYTYNLKDEKIEEDKLGKDGVFNTDESKYRNQTKFTMPNINEGSIIEYKYTIRSPFYWSVDDFVFQDEIPIHKLDASLEAPEYFMFKPNFKGFLQVNSKQERNSDKITFQSKDRSDDGFSNSPTKFHTSELNFMKNITLYNLTNIPALKEEPYVNNIDNYRSSVTYELSYTKFPDAPVKYYSTTWEDVVRTIYESSSFDPELNKTGYFEDDINAIIADVSDPLARASKIYNFVKSRMKWNSYYGMFCDEGVKKAYKEQVGNVAEINLMLTAMLRYAGLNANPVLVSTRHHGIPIFPTIDGYNYVISVIETDNGTILLDATNKYSTPNILPFRTLNWEGRIIRKDKSSTTINLYPNSKSSNIVYMMASLSDSGVLEGSTRTTKSDHNAMNYREDYLESDKTQFLEKLENKYDGIEISDFEVKNDSDLSKPITETYKFIKEYQADILGDKIYFSPLFFLKTSENPFKLGKREFPVDFGYPSESKYVISIDLPEGYKVESIPEPVAITLADNLGSYKFNLVQNGNRIQLVINSEINHPIIAPIYYDALKAYFSKIIELEGGQIVLTKV